MTINPGPSSIYDRTNNCSGSKLVAKDGLQGQYIATGHTIIIPCCMIYGFPALVITD